MHFLVEGTLSSSHTEIGKVPFFILAEIQCLSQYNCLKINVIRVFPYFFEDFADFF